MYDRVPAAPNPSCPAPDRRAQLQRAPAPCHGRHGCQETAEPGFRGGGLGFTMAKFVLAGEWFPRPSTELSKRLPFLTPCGQLAVILTGFCSTNSNLCMDHPNVQNIVDPGDTVEGRQIPPLEGLSVW